MAVISVSLPDSMLPEVDDLVKAGGYSSRSELVREALLKTIEDYRKGRPEYSMIVVLSDHSRAKNVDQSIIRVIHRYGASIVSLHHQILRDPCCITTIIIEETETTPFILKALRSLRGVIKVSRLPININIEGQGPG
ncbi:MAG: ribbon-helix-helix protein, CopG family [Desulfurococcales archaeon]|nr:ribbon-helix-helix protein, CopG family [Desulfurococcales archaeon]